MRGRGEEGPTRKPDRPDMSAPIKRKRPGVRLFPIAGMRHWAYKTTQPLGMPPKLGITSRSFSSRSVRINDLSNLESLLSHANELSPYADYKKEEFKMKRIAFVLALTLTVAMPCAHYQC